MSDLDPTAEKDLEGPWFRLTGLGRRGFTRNACAAALALDLVGTELRWSSGGVEGMGGHGVARRR